MWLGLGTRESRKRRAGLEELFVSVFGVARLIVMCAVVACASAVARAGEPVVAAPRSYGLERVGADIISGNTRLVILGDSIAVMGVPKRTPAGIMMTWEALSWKGFMDNSDDGDPVRFVNNGVSFPSLEQAIGAAFVPAGRAMYQLVSNTGPHFGVPFRALREVSIEWNGATSGLVPFANGGRQSLMRYWCRRVWFGGIPADQVFGGGISARLVYWYMDGVTAASAPLELALWNGAGNIGAVQAFNLETDAHHRPGGITPSGLCNSIGPVLLGSVFAGSEVELLLRNENAAAGPGAAHAWAQANQGRMIHSVSPVIYRQDDGLMLASLSDNSWDYDSHYEDVISTPTVSKRYTNAQVESVLRAMDVDSAQQPVFMVHLAPEVRAMNEFGQVVNASTLGYSVDGFRRYAEDGYVRIISRYRAISSALGWPEPKFVLVGCWYIRYTGLNAAQGRNAVEGQSLAAYNLARADPGVAYCSVYYDADGSIFDGTDLGAEAWLDANGYGDQGSFVLRGVGIDLTAGAHTGIIAGGDLLDTSVVHQQDEPSAAFFAHRMWRMIVEDSCPDDVNGDFSIDVNDISTVLFRLGDTGLAGAGPTALRGDANRDGVVDVNDISSVLFGLGDICPGAAIGAWPTP